MGRTVKHAMSLEDSTALRPSVKKLAKNWRKEQRDTRQAKDMSPAQHVWYAVFWQLFVPNNGKVAWTLLAAVATAWIVKG